MLALLLAVINLSNADPSPVTMPPAHIGDKVGGSLDLQTPLVSGSQTLGTAAACAGGDPRITRSSFDASNTVLQAASTCPTTDDGLFTNNPFAIVPDAMRAMLLPEFSRYVPGARFGGAIAPVGAPSIVPSGAPAAVPGFSSSAFSHDVRLSSQAPTRMMFVAPRAAGGGGRGH